MIYLAASLLAIATLLALACSLWEEPRHLDTWTEDER